MKSNKSLSEVASYRLINFTFYSINWVQVFKSEPSKICGRQPLKHFIWSTLEYIVPIIFNKT